MQTITSHAEAAKRIKALSPDHYVLLVNGIAKARNWTTSKAKTMIREYCEQHGGAGA